MSDSIDRFFDRRSEVIAREQWESERKYARLFNCEPGVPWEYLSEEEQALRILALKDLAGRGYLILGA